MDKRAAKLLPCPMMTVVRAMCSRACVQSTVRMIFVFGPSARETNPLLRLYWEHDTVVCRVSYRSDGAR